VQVPLTQAEREALDELCKELGLKPVDVIRRGLNLLVEQHKKETLPPTICMSGNKATLAAKEAALEAFRVCGNVAVAANRAGVTSRTIALWAQSDPVFNELANEAKALSVGHIRVKLHEQAAEGNTVAMFGVLNALDPEFGAVRTAMIQKVVEPLLELVIRHARRYISGDDLQRFAIDVGRSGEQVSIAATSRNRR
jgi:hypothetical protein